LENAPGKNGDVNRKITLFTGRNGS